jgi:ABC-type Fe3+/spermidine/putrescine transport system ATPase subunit
MAQAVVAVFIAFASVAIVLGGYQLLGPAGSGKTTLLRCLAGIERIDSGRIAIGDRMVADGRAHVPPEQRDLSMVFQDYALWPDLNARDNVAFALRRRKLPKAERQARAVRATPFVARFTGLAGEIRVRVTSHAQDGSVEVTAEETGQAFAVLAGSMLASAGPVVLAPGTEAVLAIRPTGVRLASVSGGERHLTGKVTDVAFRGRGYEHAIDVPGHGRLTGIFSDTRAARGDQVGLCLEPGGVHLFPAQDAPAARASGDGTRDARRPAGTLL